MNKKNILFLAALLFFGLLFSIVYYLNKPKDYLISKHRLISRINPSNLIGTDFQSYKIRVLGDKIFTLDFDNNRIYQFDTRGNVMQQTNITVRKMSTPLIIDFDLDPDETIRIADVKNHQFIDVDQNRTLKTEQSLEKFSRAKYVGNGQFLCKTFDKTFENDDVIILANNKRRLLTNLLPKFNDGGMATDGFFVANEKYYCHISYHMGSFITWDKMKNKTSRFHTIDRYNVPPKVIKGPNGNFSLTGDYKNINICGAADLENLYILSNVRSVSERRSEYDKNNVVDVYNLHTGKYQRSYYIPKIDGNPIVDMAVHANKLFTVQGKTIASYDII